MSPAPDSPIESFQKQLAAAERLAFESRIEWGVREAQLERRLASLNQRASGMRRTVTRSNPPAAVSRDPVSLYSSRWCHVARRSLTLAK